KSKRCPGKLIIATPERVISPLRVARSRGTNIQWRAVKRSGFKACERIMGIITTTVLPAIKQVLGGSSAESRRRAEQRATVIATLPIQGVRFLLGRVAAHRCHSEIAILRTEPGGKCGVGQLVMTRFCRSWTVVARPDPSMGGPTAGRALMRSAPCLICALG